MIVRFDQDGSMTMEHSDQDEIHYSNGTIEVVPPVLEAKKAIYDEEVSKQ